MIVGGGFVNAGSWGKNLKDRAGVEGGRVKKDFTYRARCAAAERIKASERRNNRVNPRPYVAPKRRPVVR